MYRLLLILLCCSSSVAAQPLYTTANAHSHNDYEQDIPFWKAYYRQFGSMEADIFLDNNQSDLWVAHTPQELALHKRSLDSLYLQPLLTCIRNNKGFVYADTTKKLQLLIDIKTAAIPTLNRLVSLLQQYPAIINNRSVQFVISGNRPDPSLFVSYPSFIWFDGNMKDTYNEAPLARIALMSADFKKFTSWNGKGRILANELAPLQIMISAMHALGKPVRFWAVPDSINAWYTMMRLQVNYINTDRIDPLADFLQHQ